jgi:hypothetical protein
MRDYIYICKVAHRSGASITSISNLKFAAEEALLNIKDLTDAIGPINKYGNVISYYGTGLQIQKSAGRAYRFMWWSGVTRKNPSYPSSEDAALTPITFNYCQQKTGGGVLYTPSQTAIIPGSYDIGNSTLGTVPNDKYTIQRVYYFPKTNSIYVFYDRVLYDTMADAEAAAVFVAFSLGTDFFDGAILRSYICVKGNATDLSNATHAVFLEKISGTAAGSSGGGGNTASNVGLTGQSVVNGKVGVDLQFNSISAGSAKIVVASDVTNKSVTIDLAALDTDDITEGTKLYYTTARSIIAAGGMVKNSIVYNATAGTIMLSGDEASPSVSKYYGTDSGSNLGYHALPVSPEPGASKSFAIAMAIGLG